MFPVSAGSSEPSVPLKTEPSEARSSGVTAATPAKRVTFFKSGDAQFAGVRMAIHKRSFKCFDALLDDLSRRVPLPFGVRAITTPRGTHSISHLEQLQDGGCYLCTDRRPVKPRGMEEEVKRTSAWLYSRPYDTRRKPSKPEEAAVVHSGQHYLRHPKKVVLVKNSDPTVRRSIILNRRMIRGLRVFMEEISELMQCHIRKLYTLEGRKIDSIQSLMRCPGVLVCVGREPFRPLLVESLKRASGDKLPGLVSGPRSSVCSEGHDINFGLETKKSIIHPRSDSSNRSTRFSLSSEKSDPNGVNMAPGSNTSYIANCSHPSEALMNDDIEKRVIVNKDGSLSVEMKVRFRLHNDETLQWSTEIKKSLGAVSDRCLENEETRKCLQHGKFESCTDPRSSGTDDVYGTNLEEAHCQNCCNHYQDYDIWKNPIHVDKGTAVHIRSSSSSASSHKIVCKKASVEDMCTLSESSEEYAEHMVQKTTCFRQVAEGGDTRVEYCSISRCCSQGEVCTASRSRMCAEEKYESPSDDETRSDSVASDGSKSMNKDQVSIKTTPILEHRAHRPISSLSAMSNSSKILQALREDLDDDDDGDDDDDDDDEDDDNLPQSVSRVSLWSHCDNPDDCTRILSIASNCSNMSQRSVSSMHHLSPRPPNKASVCSARSKKFRNHSKSVSPTLQMPMDDHENTLSENSDAVGHVVSATSKCSLRSRELLCPQTGLSDLIPNTKSMKMVEAEVNDSILTRSASKPSDALLLSNKSQKMSPFRTDTTGALPDGQNMAESNGQNAEETGNTMLYTGMRNSGRTSKSNQCPHCGGAYRTPPPGLKLCENPYNISIDEFSSRTDSVKSNAIIEHSVDRTVSPLSVKTNSSSQCRKPNNSTNVNKNGTVRERIGSAISAKTNVSMQSVKSNNSNFRVNSQLSIASDSPDAEEEEDDIVSTGSTRKNISSQSKRSNNAQCNMSDRVTTPVSVSSDKPCDQKVEATLPEMAERSESTMSAMTSVSAKSQKSNSKCSTSGGALETVRIKERVSSWRSDDSKASERIKTPVSQDNTYSVAEAEKTGLHIGTKILKDSSCDANDGSLIPPKICTIGEDDDELESEENSLSANSKVSGMSIKSHRCDSVVSQRNESSASVKMSKRDTDRVAEEVAETVIGSTSARSIVCEKLRKSQGGDNRATNGEVTLAPKRDSELETTESVNSLTSHVSTKSKSKKTASKPLTSDTMNGTENTEEKAKNTVFFNNVSEESKKLRQSDHYSSLSIITPTLSVPEIFPLNKTDRTSMIAACRKPSARSKTCSHININGDGGHSNNVVHTENEDAKAGDASETGTVIEKGMASVDSKKPPTNYMDASDISLTAAKSVSYVSAQCASRKVNAKEELDVYENDTSKSSRPNISPSLEVRGENITLEVKAHSQGIHSVKTKVSKKTSRKDVEVMDNSRPNSVVMSIVSQSCLSPGSPKGTPKEKKKHVADNGDSHDSDLCQSLSAAERPDDITQDTGESKDSTDHKTNNVREMRGCYKTVNDSKSDNGIRYKQRNGSSSSCRKGDDVSDVMPSSLPNASPTEVVHEWLKKIPKDSPMYDMGEEYHEHAVETSEQVNVSEKAEPLSPKELVQLDNETVKPIKGNEEVNGAKELNDEAEKPFAEESTQKTLPSIDTKDLTNSTSRQALPKSCQSSVQVMKVLLNPKFNRCNSLPEVSPVYGRKLSTSAKELLDCLANLDVIDSEPMDIRARDVRYNEVMNILQSLWLCDPSDSEQSTKLKSHKSVDDPKSSSGVDVSSGSAGSGKDSENGGVDQTQKIELAQRRGAPLAEQETLRPLQEETSLSDGTENTNVSSNRLDIDAKEPPVVSDPATPDIASRVRETPRSEELSTDDEKHKGEDSPDSNETIRSNVSPKEITETPYSSNKSSGNDTLKLPDENESGSQEVVGSRIPKLTKKASQDPDPLWVLSLLKKIEKQFMAHYVNAMAEFKVRWDLDDNEMLDTMINELRDEVNKRIQASINREMQKIQSRAGRGPRPPMKAISRESSVQTEQRRRRLRVMHKTSVNESPQRSDENYTGTGTDFSEQRSEEEYCPCDSCMKKKMASRLAERRAIASSAPLMVDFDLRKILQMKREPPVLVKEESSIEKKTDNNGVLQDKTEENAVDEKPHEGHCEVEELVERQGEDRETDDLDVDVDNNPENENDRRQERMDGRPSVQEEHKDTTGDAKGKELGNVAENDRDEVNEESSTSRTGEPSEENDAENCEEGDATEEGKAAEKDETAAEDGSINEEGETPKESSEVEKCGEDDNMAQDEKIDGCGEATGEELADQDQFAVTDDKDAGSVAIQSDEGDHEMTEDEAAKAGSTEGAQTTEDPDTEDVNAIREDEAKKLTGDSSLEKEREDKDVQSNKDSSASENHDESGEEITEGASGEALAEAKTNVVEDTEEDNTDGNPRREPQDESVEEQNAVVEKQETGNSEADARESPGDEIDAEGDVEDSGTDTGDKEHDGDSTENNTEACDGEAISNKGCGDDPEEPEHLEEERAEQQRNKLKGITMSSIQSQPGSIESALDHERKLKDAESSLEN